MPINITGIQAGLGPGKKLPIRREIDEWWFSKDPNDANQRSLFIYALKAFMTKSLDPSTDIDDLSYFAIAGIHGLPVTPWPKKGGAAEGDATSPFYCAHGRVTFATWHTPYMLLYEQRLYEEMKALIPKEFNQSEQAELSRAADTWRLPFWDWASKKPTWNVADPNSPDNIKAGVRPNVPFIITQPLVEVRVRGGTSTKVPNPMYQFALKPGQEFSQYGVNSARRKWIGKCRVTSRWPSTVDDTDKNFQSDYVEGQNQDYRKITNQLQGTIEETDDKTKKVIYFANSLPEAVRRLLNTADKDGNPVMSFEQFSTQNYKDGQSSTAFPSIEAIHNNLHYFAGGSGFMGNPATAAFDPIFWLHHCNVDRILAIWQNLYAPAYKKWLASKPDKNGEGPDKELIPFFDADGKLYTSNTCSFKHAELGYTYPELQEWNFNGDRQAFLDSIRAEITRLYSTTAKASLLLTQNAPQMTKQMSAMTASNLALENFPAPLIVEATEKAQTLVASAPMAQIASVPFGKPPPLTWTNNDYVVNVKYERFALDGKAFVVTIFLGDVPANGSYDFKEDPTAIGCVYNFSSSAETRGFDAHVGCESCKKDQADHVASSGQVILTDYLIQQIYSGEAQRGLTLTSLEKDEVVPYLQKNLHWRITDVYGTVILKEDVPSLKIAVAMATSTHSSDPKVSTIFGPYEVLWDVTSGRLAGAAQGEL